MCSRVKDYCKSLGGYAEHELLENFCRSDKITAGSRMMFMTQNDCFGPCSMSVGSWHWADDINKLALYVCEVHVKAIVAWYEDRALEDVATTPALEFVASVPGPDPDTKAELIAHIKRLYDLIDRDELSAADLADWTRGIERCLDEMDYGIEVEVFDRLSDAQELLREHEEERLSRDEYAERVKLTLAERFEKDLIF